MQYQPYLQAEVLAYLQRPAEDFQEHLQEGPAAGAAVFHQYVSFWFYKEKEIH